MSFFNFYFELSLYPKGTLYHFYFASDPMTDNNQTFIVSGRTNITQSLTVGFSGNLTHRFI